MIWRVVLIIGFMLRRLVGYFWYAFQGRTRQAAYRLWAYVTWSGYVLKLFQVDLEVQGREFVPSKSDRPRIFLCNHQSQLDIPVLVASVEDEIGFVAKKELGRIPLLSYWMRQVGCVFIDRSDKSGARKSLELLAASLTNQTLVVFPEGTRSKTGALLPIKSGGLRMALMAGAQIIPVHICNSRSAFEARASKAEGSIPVRLRFFPSMDLREWPDERASWQKVKEYLEECWNSTSPPAPLH